MERVYAVLVDGKVVFASEDREQALARAAQHAHADLATLHRSLRMRQRVCVLGKPPFVFGDMVMVSREEVR